jgi:glyoxylase-like metal-dependent hydrolase (beta-lactamase superfamily II)
MITRCWRGVVRRRLRMSPTQVARRFVSAGQEVQLTEYCGHTRGDTVAYFPAARAIAVGDLIAWPDESIPQIVNYGDGGNWTDALKTLETIAALDWDVLVPGHGPVMTKQDLRAHLTKHKAIVDRAKALIKQGRTEAEVTQALTAEFNWSSGVAGLMMEFR